MRFVGIDDEGKHNHWCPSCGTLLGLFGENKKTPTLIPNDKYRNATFFVCSGGDAPSKIYFDLGDAFDDLSRFIDLFDINGNPVGISFELTNEETLEYACSIAPAPIKT